MKERSARHDWLRKTYTFDCACQLCSAPTEKDASKMTDEFNRRFRCKVETCSGLLVPKNGLQVGECAMCGAR